MSNVYQQTADYPDEFHNVSARPEYAEVQDRYRTRLLEWRMATEDQSWTRFRWEGAGHIGDWRPGMPGTDFGGGPDR